ncbi:MAG: hypothetical protein WAV66_09540, partial [Anaerolineae bacterium]
SCQSCESCLNSRQTQQLQFVTIMLQVTDPNLDERQHPSSPIHDDWRADQLFIARRGTKHWRQPDSAEMDQSTSCHRQLDKSVDALNNAGR